MCDAFLAYLVGLWWAGPLIDPTVGVTLMAGCGGVGHAGIWEGGRGGGGGFVVKLLACRSIIYVVRCSSGASRLVAVYNI